VAVKGIRARNFDAADELEEGVKVLQALRAVVESTTTIDEEVKAELLRLTMAAIERSNEGIIAGRNGSGPGLEAAARDAITLSRQAFSLSLNTVVE
ncbi:MAG TPA: hypothetical protein VK689_19220, partial [Armatimonadota bacterium]|nr:hypothetical protein [Armatimonadota bacterium]